MSTGEYSEKLTIPGATLKVTSDNYYISFYFPGPDYRYNGDFLNITSDEIDEYIIAYKNNWVIYKQLEDLKLDGEITKTGDKNMTIRCGGYYTGICLNHYHLPICSLDDLNKLIEELASIKERAIKIQNAISDL